MPHSHPDSEEALENATMALFAQLGWQTADCFEEVIGPHGTLGRETTSQVVLIPRLRAAMEKLNPDLPAEALNLAIEELTRDRSAQSLANANHEIYQLLKDGVKVTVAGGSLAPRGRRAGTAPSGQGPMLRDEAESPQTVRVIDWNTPANNDFFLASQFWVSGEMYKRRADLVGFVNGLPLVFVELKSSHKKLKTAYDNNLRDYKVTIPHIFWHNALIILSNGSHSLMGSLTAEWEHFADWQRINSEGEQGIISLDTMIRGTCAPVRLLDIIENFILFAETKEGLVKLVARNHQYLGVNNAIQAVQDFRQNQGRLGVFWHTQGSGKSYSMVFFAQKVLRKLPGNWTFLVVTDRQDLDNQIYKNFASAGAVTEPEDAVRAESGEHLKQLLQQDHRYVFTLIQKFHTRKGGRYPVLSERSDIIVMPDEAHRTQYDALALNMRNALPNAAFIAYTGTPLMAGEEKTRAVFGSYVSIYNFKQSADDGNTVPLYYENRIPEVQLTNQDLNRDMEQLLEDAELDEAQEAKLEREFSREYHLITRDDRLNKIAEDIVLHFMGRGYLGKAMVVSIDKATAVRMYDKVQAHWKKHLAYLKAELEELASSLAPRGRWAQERAGTAPCGQGAMLQDRLAELEAKVKVMQETNMAVVVSQSQNEIEDIKKKGADITPHRKRMLAEDLDTKFKDPADPFRIVFVCAMWMTGFDVPCCSTIYLDKPMRNHTLMQTIARANRVFADKVNGLIVDYIGVFRDLQHALAIYGSASGGGVQPGELPVQGKAALVEKLRQAAASATATCVELGIDLDAVQAAEGFQRVKLLEDAVEAVLVNDESKRKFLGQVVNVDRLFKAILPDQAANEFSPTRAALVVITDKLRSELPDVDISDVMGQVEDLLNRSVAARAYVIHEPAAPYDLSRIDFAKLSKAFAQGRKHTQAAQLQAAISAKLQCMVTLNKSRLDYAEQFQKMIDEYNAGASDVDLHFARLVAFVQGLNDEEQRGIKEQLSEEELAVFDLLTKPDIKLTRAERDQVKKVAKELLVTLKAERLVLDWRKRQQTRARVRQAIEITLDKLPDCYTKGLYERKCEAVYQHVYDAYYGEGKGIYPLAV